MRRMVVGLAGGVALVASRSAAGQGSPPACEAASPPAWAFSAPMRLAYGRKAAVGAYENVGSSASSSFADVTVQAADPRRPISHSQTRTLIAGDSVPILFERGVGSALVTAKWTERRGGSSSQDCSGSWRATVAPVAGRVPAFNVHRAPFGFTVHVMDPSITTESCDSWASGRVSLQVRGGRQNGTLVIGDTCAAAALLSHPSTRGTVDGAEFKLSAESLPGHAAFTPVGRVAGVRSFAWVVRVGERVARRGRFWVRVRRIPGYDIFEGSDDFVNVCI